MKTAILLTGHMRSFERCLPTLHWHVFRHFPAADFYVSTVKDANSHKADLLREKYPQARVEIDVVDAQPELPIPQGPAGWKVGQGHYGHEPYAISVHPQAILRQLWQLQRGWDFMVGRNDKPVYDLIIRCRPDLWFHSCAVPNIEGSIGAVALTPWWGRFGGVNDRFAFLGTNAAEAYCTTLRKLPDLMALGCPLHPESLIKASLEFGGCVINDQLRAEFSTLRDDGTFRAPEAPLADQVHAAMAHP